jgi:hypothetical protein
VCSSLPCGRGSGLDDVRRFTHACFYLLTWYNRTSAFSFKKKKYSQLVHIWVFFNQCVISCIWSPKDVIQS